MQHSLAIVAEPDWAMRELMRRCIEAVGFIVLESGGLSQLQVLLRTRAILSASHVLLVVPTNMTHSCEAAFVDLLNRRESCGQTRPFLALTCEFGTLSETPRPDAAGFALLDVLEKPFDLSVLQGLAQGCRRTPSRSPTDVELA